MVLSVLDKVNIVRGDILDIASDLLVLKYADGFHGADKAVADAIGFSDPVPAGSSRYIETPGHPFGGVLFIGTGPLFSLYYTEIRDFGFDLARQAFEHLGPRGRITTTVHGVGVGLDEKQLLLSELTGIEQASARIDGNLPRIDFIERDEQRAKRLQTYLTEIEAVETTRSVVLLDRTRQTKPENSVPQKQPLSVYIEHSMPSADKREAQAANWKNVNNTLSVNNIPTLFVAMPFADECRDEYDIAFVEAAHNNDFLCERLDLASFTGDVIQEMERRIRRAKGMIALMNGDNPNVFLEIGYALALGKPLILVARAGQKIPFDVRNMRRITYTRIAELRDLMRKEIAALDAEGIL